MVPWFFGRAAVVLALLQCRFVSPRMAWQCAAVSVEKVACARPILAAACTRSPVSVFVTNRVCLSLCKAGAVLFE